MSAALGYMTLAFQFEWFPGLGLLLIGLIALVSSAWSKSDMKKKLDEEADYTQREREISKRERELQLRIREEQLREAERHMRS